MDDAAPLSTRIADPLERAMAFVEARAFEPLTLADIAAAAALSPYHFSRQFSARFGLTPMAFVRARRLGLAAKALASPTPPQLVDLAFDAGFESQEAFTRAFKRAFGVSPGRYRRGAALPTETTFMSDAAAVARVTQEPAPVKKPGFRVAGLSAVFDQSSKSNIPLLWRKLDPHLPLPGQLGGGAAYGVGCPTETAIEGCFRYAAAVPIDAGAPVPDGIEVFDIPAQAYLIFRLQTDGSELHPQMQAAMREIWGHRIPASGYKLRQGPDLEVYPPGFQDDRPAGLEWWIPVEA
ncbi:MAG TPA: AraC family transcriptional regulator [Caulobacteraceae bacterium]|nr:AraC family transcriptional regulator [Caulobacteraceae bacterium]